MNIPPVRPSSPEDPTTGPAVETSHEEDARLVHETLAGRESSFEALFRRHRERVYRIAYRFTRNRDDALEVTQDVFIKTHRALASYNGQATVTTWICRIATNAAIDWKRRQKVHASEFEDGVLVPDLPSSPALVRRPKDPGRETIRRELAEKIQEAVDLLSEKHRAVFVLHAMEGLTYQEIADAVGCRIGTVMSRLHYARKNLRKHLRPYLGAEAPEETEGEEP